VNNDDSDSGSSGSINSLFYSNKELCGIDLSGKNLTNVELRSANLSYGNFNGSNFKNADLRNANLAFCSLRNAWLCGANLQGVRLNQTDFRGAIFDSQTKFDFDAKMAGMVEVSELSPPLVSIQKRELVLI